jgi:hypothetical protein
MNIKRRRRIQASRPYGLRGEWIEFQVWSGRKILGRFDTLRQAEAFISANEAAERGETNPSPPPSIGR